MPAALTCPVCLATVPPLNGLRRCPTCGGDLTPIPPPSAIARRAEPKPAGPAVRDYYDGDNVRRRPTRPKLKRVRVGDDGGRYITVVFTVLLCSVTAVAAVIFLGVVMVRGLAADARNTFARVPPPAPVAAQPPAPWVGPAVPPPRDFGPPARFADPNPNPAPPLFPPNGLMPEPPEPRPPGGGFQPPPGAKPPIGAMPGLPPGIGGPPEAGVPTDAVAKLSNLRRARFGLNELEVDFDYGDDRPSPLDRLVVRHAAGVGAVPLGGVFDAKGTIGVRSFGIGRLRGPFTAFVERGGRKISNDVTLN